MFRIKESSVDRDSGFVLVVILWVVAMLTVMTLSFAERAILEVKAARYTLDHAQARMMARAAVYRGMLELQHKAINDYVESYENPEIQRGTTHLGQAWANRVDMLAGETYFENAAAYANDTVFYEIEDLAARIDINRADLEFLSSIEQLDAGVRRRITATRPLASQSRNDTVQFHTLEELRYIDGMQEEAWVGERGEPGVRDLFTVWGDENSEGRVNVNTAPLAVLEAIPGMDDSKARAILLYRGGDLQTGTGGTRPFNSVAELAEVTELGADELERYCMLSSTYFMIRGVATRQGGKVRAACTAVVHLDGSQALLKTWHEDLLGGQIQ
jgi:type II secretory pathway component PulK